MKRLNKNIRIIIVFIIGIILASSITVYAYSYVANDIKYIKKEENGTETEISVEQALNELYSRKKKIEPLETEFGMFEMGTRTGITNNDLVFINGLNNYKTLTIECKGNMGTYISARIYIDNNLIITISDLSEHVIELNNNNEMKINFYCYNSLTNGVTGVKVKAE